MEAFKAGQIDLRSENISKNWATAYDFPAVARGLVIKHDFSHHLPTGMQGYAMNTRRPVFANPLVRQAMAETFDFEWANKNLFYGSYTRTQSYFSQQPPRLVRNPAGRRAEAAGAVPQGTAAGAVHRAVQAAGDRRLGQQPRAVAPRAGPAAAGRLVGEGAQAGRQERQSDELHHPARRAVAGARGAALCATAAEARHRRAGAHGRSGAVPAPDRRLRLRHDHDDLSGGRHSGQRAARLLLLRGGKAQGSFNAAGDLRSGGRCAGRADRHGAGPRDADHRGARAGPGAAVALVSWCRTGTAGFSTLPIGTASAIRTSRSARGSTSIHGGWTRQNPRRSPRQGSSDAMGPLPQPPPARGGASVSRSGEGAPAAPE